MQHQVDASVPDEKDDCELDLGLGAANELLESLSEQVAANPPPIFEDCVCGDAGAAAAVETLDAAASSAGAGGPAAPVTLQEVYDDLARAEAATESAPSSSSRERPFLPLTSSFLTVFAGIPRTHALEHGWLQFRDNVSPTTTTTFAEVFADEALTDRLGTIGTAAPLGETKGLRASCDKHKIGKAKCMCWINFKKDKAVTPEDRWMLFRALADWLGTADSTDQQAHADASFTLRVAAGMTPRILQRGRGGLPKELLHKHSGARVVGVGPETPVMSERNLTGAANAE